MENVKISVVLSTYNAEEWLEKVLWGYSVQSYKNFEIVIADDGSRNTTKELIEKMAIDYPVPIEHVWHEDNGFQKSQILNKAILACKGSYIIMSDGDCIPRKDFVQCHAENMTEGYFLSGGYFMLPMDISQLIDRDDILTNRCFKVDWLKKNGLTTSFKNNKLSADGYAEKLLNFITPTKATWNGHNASGWKKDIVKVNGFDERMQYGGQDRELGERLFNLGIKSKQIRYSAIVLHLDHARGYKNQESINKNLAIRKQTKDKKIIKTPYGIEKMADSNDLIK